MRRFLVLAVSVLSLGPLTATLQADGDLHLRLDRSAPAEDSTVESPAEIRLWFSQATQEDATSIRLLDASGELVELGRVTPADGHAVHFAAVPQALAPGRYTVSWRTMAADGHVVRGDFGFAVTSTR